MNNIILELFGIPNHTSAKVKWSDIVRKQHCPYLNSKCLKNRKSAPEISIGTCIIKYSHFQAIIICPYRLLERKQIFADALHLLALHEPGNELHVVPEVSIPGGSVDYFLVSARDSKVRDFVGIEVQTLDTTGTIWPVRQRFLAHHGVAVRKKDTDASSGFGMNWKMTAKTTLVQLHHKIETFEGINKHLVLIVQDCLMAYMRKEFSFEHLEPALLGNPLHFHSYSVSSPAKELRLKLNERLSTNSRGVSICLGLKASANIAVENITRLLESKLSSETILSL
jgi:hypothetical protein